MVEGARSGQALAPRPGKSSEGAAEPNPSRSGAVWNRIRFPPDPVRNWGEEGEERNGELCLSP